MNTGNPLSALMHSLIAQFHYDRICRLFLASAWALVRVTRVVFRGSTRATPVMASRQRSGTRTLKVVVAVAFAVRLAKLLPTSLCSLIQPLPLFLFETPRRGKVRVYHYNKAGYEGILESGCIQPSDIRQGDASYGSSVYATELDPSVPFYAILHNNYDMDGGIQGRGEARMDRADYVFAFDLDISSVEFIDNAGRRSVLCIGGGDKMKVDDALYFGNATIAADVLKNRGKKVLVYHYTNKEGYERILANGYILPEDLTTLKTLAQVAHPSSPIYTILHNMYGGLQAQVMRGVRGTSAHPSSPIYTILHNMYGGHFNGRGKDMLDRADYVFAFLLPADKVDMLKRVPFSQNTGKVMSLGHGKRVDITEAFYHGASADAFHETGLNHSVFESEEEVLMYLQIYDAVNKQGK